MQDQINQRASELAKSAIRLDNDLNGNPRFYVPKFLFPAMPDAKRLKAGLAKYRGKKFGAGFVFQSYNLAYDLTQILNILAK